MIDLEKFRAQWAATRAVPRGYTRVKVKPLECYIGYDAQLRKSLIVISSCRAGNFISSKSVEIRQARKDTSRVQLEINLRDENLEEVFVRMCCDLLKYSASSLDEQAALKNFENRYRQWQNLFDSGKSGFLSEQEQHGLAGELLFLRSQIIERRRPLYEAVSGWHGPLNEHQDFSYGDKWYEIKTVMEQASKIQISSLEQLSRLDDGELVIYRLSKISGRATDFTPAKFTLNLLAENLQSIFCEDDAAALKFQSLLLQAGYIALPEYDEPVYKIAEKLAFEVDDKFPRLVKEKLPAAVLSASYSLEINALKEKRNGA